MTSDRAAAFHRINILADRADVELPVFRALCRAWTGKVAMTAMTDGELGRVECGLGDIIRQTEAGG